MSKFISVKEAAAFYDVEPITIYKAIETHGIKTKKQGKPKCLHVDTSGLNKHLTNARLRGIIYK